MNKLNNNKYYLVCYLNSNIIHSRYQPETSFGSVCPPLKETLARQLPEALLYLVCKVGCERPHL